MEENCPILMSKRNAIFSVSPPCTSFLPINTWQRGDEKSRIKTNEFRFRRANFIQRTSQVLPSIPRTTLNHYDYYYGLCHLFYNVNREWMPACLLRPIKISICRAEYQRTRYTETSVTLQIPRGLLHACSAAGGESVLITERCYNRFTNR